MKTQMREAMRSAGLDPEIRLQELEDWVVSETSDTDAALDLLFATISVDAALQWELFKSVRRPVCLERLRAAFARNRKSDATTGVTNQMRSASEGDRTSGQGTADIQLNDAARPSAALQFHEARTALTRSAKSFLDTFQTPLGRPIGNITGAEARSLHTKTSRDARIYRFCANHTPLDRLVRDFVKAEDLEAVAKDETHAA